MSASFYASSDYDNFLRNLKARRFKLKIARNTTDEFKEVGLIAVDSVSIRDLRTDNVVQGGALQGYEFAMIFTVPNMSVFADNQYVVDREEISDGRWFVSLIDIETNWVRITPFAVALDLIEADFQGTQYSLRLRTSDLEWIKHKSPTSPTVVEPIILDSSVILPATHTQSNSMSFGFKLSNPSLSPSIQNDVLYDILIYSNPAFTILIGSAINKTKAQIVDATMPNSQVLDPSDNPFVFERGRVYYGIARCKYGGEQADTLFRFTTQFTAPTLSGFPSSVEIPTNSFFQGTAARGAANALATEAEFEWQVGTTSQSNVTSIYNSSGNATGLFNLPNVAPTLIKVRARSRNASVISDWSDYQEISMVEEDFTLSINGAGESSSNPLILFPGEENNVTVGVNRTGNSLVTINNVNTNPNAYPRGKNVPQSTSGTTFLMTTEVGAIDKNDYSFSIRGQSVLNTIDRQATVYVRVNDIADLPHNNRLLWLRAEDILNLVDGNGVSEWVLYNRSNMSYETNPNEIPYKFVQNTANRQPTYRSANSTQTNPFKNIQTPYGTKSYPCVHFDADNKQMDLRSMQNMATQFQCGGEVSLYIVTASNGGGSSKVLLCHSGLGPDFGNGSVRYMSLMQSSGFGIFGAGLGYSSSGFSFFLQNSPNVRMVHSVRWDSLDPTNSNTRMQRNRIDDADIFTPGTASFFQPDATTNWRINRLGGTADSGNNSTLNYYLAELVIFGKRLSSGENLKVMNYFRAKYGVDANSSPSD